jgi:hypothetical protein
MIFQNWNSVNYYYEKSFLNIYQVGDDVKPDLRAIVLKLAQKHRQEVLDGAGK